MLFIPGTPPPNLPLRDAQGEEIAHPKDFEQTLVRKASFVVHPSRRCAAFPVRRRTVVARVTLRPAVETPADAREDDDMRIGSDLVMQNAEGLSTSAPFDRSLARMRARLRDRCGSSRKSLSAMNFGTISEPPFRAIVPI